jgi:hypothetical protein
MIELTAMAIDLQELEEVLENMTPQQKVYGVVKRALTNRGHWKNLPRGNPSKGGLVTKARKLKEE